MDTEYRGQYPILKYGHVKAFHGIIGTEFRSRCEPEPASAVVYAEVPFFFRPKRRGPDFFDLKRIFHDIEDFVKCISVQIRDHPIVIINLKFIRGEEHGKKEIIFFISRKIRIFRSSFQPHLYGGSSSVVPVRDVEMRDAGKQMRNIPDIFWIINAPDTVPDLVIAGEIIEGRALLHFSQDCPDCLVRPVGEKDRAGLRTACIDMAESVKLLCLKGILVFQDHASCIVIHGGTAHKSGLRPSVHGK